MRTTLTIEPDVANEIAERRRATGASLKRVVNDLLRKGLRAEGSPLEPYRSEHSIFTFVPGLTR